MKIEDRDKWIVAQAKVLCAMAGIDPIDQMDGSPNWWIFNERSTKIVDDLLKDFPPLPEPTQTPSQSHEPQPKSDQ